MKHAITSRKRPDNYESAHSKNHKNFIKCHIKKDKAYMCKSNDQAALETISLNHCSSVKHMNIVLNMT